MGVRLKELRKSKGMTQLQVSERINISKAMVSSYELCTRTPSNDILMRLAKLYGVSTDYLLGLERDRSVSLRGLSDPSIKLVIDMVDKLRNADSGGTAE